MAVPEVDVKKSKHSVRRNTLIVVGIAATLGTIVLIRKIDALHEDLLDMQDAINELVQEAFPIALDVVDA